MVTIHQAGPSPHQVALVSAHSAAEVDRSDRHAARDAAHGQGGGSDRTVAALLTAREKLLSLSTASATPSTMFEALNAMRIFCPVDVKAEHVNLFFDPKAKYAVLARTLTREAEPAPNPPPDKAQPVAKPTPARLERDTLNDQRKNKVNILFTPATLIDPDAAVSTISSNSDSARARWSGTPSVLYTAPTLQRVDMLGKVDGYKKSFGNALSFASNRGFTPEFLSNMRSGRYSHAQLLDQFRAQPVIENNLKGKGNLANFQRSLPGLKHQVLGLPPRKPGDDPAPIPVGTVPHNEVVARLWLWDAVAVDMGPDLGQGLSCAIELQLARKTLSTELKAAREALAANVQQQDIEHPLFNDFLQQQLSVGVGGRARTRSDVTRQVAALSRQDKLAVADALLTKLDQPISLCMYSPATSTIRGMEEMEMTGTDILGAFDAVLEAHLGDKPARPQSGAAP